MANKYLAKVIAQARIWAGCSIVSNRFAFDQHLIHFICCGGWPGAPIVNMIGT